MPLIPFPNVPPVPGVPAIPRLATISPLAAAGQGLLQGLLWRLFQVQTQWGVYDSSGQPLGDPSKFTGLIGAAFDSAGLGTTMSTGGIDYSKETRVSDFPVEQGSFASYNKVELPANPLVSLCLTGSENDRRSFLDAIDQATKSTDLYSVVTPEVTYVDYAIERYNYQRRANRGATLLIVELSLKEIRQVSSLFTMASSLINAPKDAGSTPKVDAGKVQAQAPQVSTLKSVATKLGIGL
jgi:hypothetical protein